MKHRSRRYSRRVCHKRGGGSGGGGGGGNTPNVSTSPTFKESEFSQNAEDQIQDWTNQRKDYINSLPDEEAAKFETKTADNADIIKAIQETYNKNNFVGVTDAKGNLQAVALVERRRIQSTLLVSYLATASWNTIDGHPKQVKGAGTQAIAAVVRRSIKEGYEGRVVLESLPGAVKFYEKIGFSRQEYNYADGSRVYTMTLSSQNAKQFLDKLGG